jgi:hypothetical protein
MTTATMKSTPLTRVPARSPWHHIASVVRLHFTNPWSTLIVPWLILGAIFVMTLAIVGIIRANLDSPAQADLNDGVSYSGSIFYIFIYMMVIAIQAISITFQFALGFGVTRRNYYLGSALTFVILAVGYTIALSALAFVEELTNGWGLGAPFFTSAYFGDGAWWQRTLVYFVGLLFCFFAGALFAGVWVRWKSYGVMVAIGLILIFLIGVFGLFSIGDNYLLVEQWFTTFDYFGNVMWLLVPTAINGVIGYLLLRRATPKS